MWECTENLQYKNLPCSIVLPQYKPFDTFIVSKQTACAYFKEWCLHFHKNRHFCLKEHGRKGIWEVPLDAASLFISKRAACAQLRTDCRYNPWSSSATALEQEWADCVLGAASHTPPSCTTGKKVHNHYIYNCKKWQVFFKMHISLPNPTQLALKVNASRVQGMIVQTPCCLYYSLWFAIFVFRSLQAFLFDLVINGK